MIYEAVYGISYSVWESLAATSIFALLMFIFASLGIIGVSGDRRHAALEGLLVALFATIIFVPATSDYDGPLRKEMLADPEYQRILGDARALDAEANKLLDRAGEIRNQIKEKRKDGKRNDSVSGDSAE